MKHNFNKDISGCIATSHHQFSLQKVSLAMFIRRESSFVYPDFSTHFGFLMQISKHERYLFKIHTPPKTLGTFCPISPTTGLGIRWNSRFPFRWDMSSFIAGFRFDHPMISPGCGVHDCSQGVVKTGILKTVGGSGKQNWLMTPNMYLIKCKPLSLLKCLNPHSFYKPLLVFKDFLWFFTKPCWSKHTKTFPNPICPIGLWIVCC